MTRLFVVLCGLLIVFAVSINATITVVVQTPDCIVMASDSRVVGKDSTIVTDTFEKQILVSKYSVAHCQGYMLVGGKSLRAVIDELHLRNRFSDTSEVFADSVRELVTDWLRRNAPKRNTVDEANMVVAGVARTGDLVVWELARSSDCRPVKLATPLSWRGSSNVCYRLMMGIDAGLRNELKDMCDSIGCLPFPDSGNVPSRLDSILENYKFGGNSVSAWSRQDAVDFASALVMAEIVFQRMFRGTFDKRSPSGKPVVGGKAIVDVISRTGVVRVEQ